MKNFHLKSIFSLAVVSAGMFLISYVLFPQNELRKIFILIFANAAFTLIALNIVYASFKLDNTIVGRTYFITVFIKIIAFGIILYPKLIFSKEELKAYLLLFIGNFFICLIIEISLLINLLKHIPVSIEKNDENQE